MTTVRNLFKRFGLAVALSFVGALIIATNLATTQVDADSTRIWCCHKQRQIVECDDDAKDLQAHEGHGDFCSFTFSEVVTACGGID